MEISSIAPWVRNDSVAIGRDELDGGRILAPLAGRGDHLRVAAAVARVEGGQLLLADPTAGTGAIREVDPTDPTPVDEADLPAFDATLARRVERTLADATVDAVVLPAVGSGEAGVRRSPTERLASRASCDALVVNGRRTPETVSSILLPVAGGPHSGLAVAASRTLASAFEAWVDVLHVVDDPDPEARSRGERLVADSRDRVASGFAESEADDRVDTWVLEADHVAATLVEQSRYYDLVVLGAPTSGLLRQFVFGSTTREVRRRVQSTVLMARRNG